MSAGKTRIVPSVHSGRAAGRVTLPSRSAWTTARTSGPASATTSAASVDDQHNTIGQAPRCTKRISDQRAAAQRMENLGLPRAIPLYLLQQRG